MFAFKHSFLDLNTLDMSYRDLTFLLGCCHPKTILQKLRTTTSLTQEMKNKNWCKFELLQLFFHTTIQSEMVNFVPP